MPTMTADKIGFFLSGGSSNLDPTRSLGGAPSSYMASGSANGLFGDASVSEALAGLVDYRCVYVFNESEDATLWGASVHIHSENSGESSLTLGVRSRDESQVVSVNGTVFFGSASFSFDGEGFSASWGGSAENFASEIGSGLLSLGVEDAQVTHTYLGSDHKFTIVFGGASSQRVQPLIQVTENLLEGVGRPPISVERQTSGSPIGALADEIATPSVPPAGVEFLETSPSSRISIGDLGPGEWAPIWIRRAVPAGSASKEGASAVIRVSGTS